MSNEDLLKPRYLVVADYPYSWFDINQIIQFEYETEDYSFETDEITGTSWKTKFMELKNRSGKTQLSILLFEQYPAIFRKLEWWEMRDEKDMPEYLKDTYDGEIFKVIEYTNTNMVYLGLNDGNIDYAAVSHFLPATEQEYINYTNSK